MQQHPKGSVIPGGVSDRYLLSRERAERVALFSVIFVSNFLFCHSISAQALYLNVTV